jgi:hypothetical protein
VTAAAVVTHRASHMGDEDRPSAAGTTDIEARLAKRRSAMGEGGGIMSALARQQVHAWVTRQVGFSPSCCGTVCTHYLALTFRTPLTVTC